MSEIASFNLRLAIEQESRRLGFELFGVTTPEPPQNYVIFENWLAAGRHAQMSYLASERSRNYRADPHLLLPECQSILVFGIRYAAPGSLDAVGDQSEIGLVGRTAAFTWGDDYHDVIPEKLGRLAVYIENLVGRPLRYRINVDSGPVLEREYAQRAGLGWKGKNALLINPEIGSFFLLGEILLDLALELDQPFEEDLCGACRRCLEACPMGCIQADRTIDAGRCIAYLTIEHKDSIPETLRSKIGDRILGCDICQQACPWNRRWMETPGDVSFMTHLESVQPDLIEDMALTAQEFNRKSKGRLLQYVKRRGYLRSVATALGSIHDARAIPVLSQALDDLEPLIRIHSAWALGQIGGDEALNSLEEALRLEDDPAVRIELAAAIENCQMDGSAKNPTGTR